MGRLRVSIVAATLIAGSAGVLALQRAEPGGAAASVDRRLTVTIGAGSGTVTSAPAGINCPQTCSSFFAAGTTVTLAATPAPGFRIDSWEPFASCTSQLDDPSICRVTIGDSDSTVRAIFRPAATVHVFPNGNGVVTVSPAGLDLDDENAAPRTSCDQAQHQRGCRLAYMPGTTVTATAAPGAGRTFAGWSDARCPAGPCTFEAPAGDLSLVATFNPLELVVVVAGEGTVTSTPAGISCSKSGGVCAVAAPRGARFVLSAGAAPHEWRFGCEPEGGDPRAARCTATVAALPTQVGISFGGAGGPAAPNRISVRLVVDTGKLQGTVRGGKIDCGATCAATYRFGDPEELRAVDTPGRRFAHWIRGCGTTPVCRFDVGPTTLVLAVFAPPLAASFVRVRVSGSGPRRVVIARIKVNQEAAVSLRLRRSGRRVATKSAVLNAGETPVRVKVPRGAAAGRYELVAIVKAGREQRRLVRAVRIGR